MATLYDLTQEQMYLYNLLASGEAIDSETGEVDPVVDERLQLNTEDLDNKIKGTAIIFKQLMADAKMLKDEEDNLANRRKRAEKNAEYLKQRLQDCMLAVGKTELKDTKVNITFRKSSRIEITSEQDLPIDYVVEKITYTPSKEAIKKAILEGKTIAGASLIETQNIQIK